MASAFILIQISQINRKSSNECQFVKFDLIVCGCLFVKFVKFVVFTVA